MEGNKCLEKGGAEVYNELEVQINQICDSQSKVCSDVCRKIVFALFLVIGAFSFDEGRFSPNIFLLFSLFFLIAYLILDVWRYFYSLYFYNRFWEMIKAKKVLGQYEECVKDIQNTSEKIARFTYRLFAVQIWGCLLLAFVSLVIGIWGVMFVEC